jgi:putative flippase GtrA
MMDARSGGQFLRYGLVGLASNLLLYVAYLGLTTLGIGHKTGMTVLYAVGVVQTFVFNRTWSFRHDGELHGAFARYVVSYACGYLLNLSMLWLAVDWLGMPHQIVQGIMVVVVALAIFLMQKYWVFADRPPSAREVA